MDSRDFYRTAKKHNLTQEDIDEMAIPSYNHYNPLIRWIFRERLRKLAGFSSFDEKIVLDFGCGTGIMFPNYKNAAKVYACDIHPQVAKETAKKINLNVNFVRDIESLRDNSIEIAIFADVLEHIDNLDELLSILKKKMRNNGLVLVSLPTESKFYKLCKFIAGYSKKAHYHLNNPQNIEKMLNKIFNLKIKHRLPRIFSLFTLYKYEVKK
jgi:2-polyprenyl-3-methyl-5-hydroxy-6-metoxy-1,4-benzoquinol methylase